MWLHDLLVGDSLLGTKVTLAALNDTWLDCFPPIDLCSGPQLSLKKKMSHTFYIITLKQTFINFNHKVNIYIFTVCTVCVISAITTFWCYFGYSVLLASCCCCFLLTSHLLPSSSHHVLCLVFLHTCTLFIVVSPFFVYTKSSHVIICQIVLCSHCFTARDLFSYLVLRCLNLSFASILVINFIFLLSFFVCPLTLHWLCDMQLGKVFSW